MRDRWRVHGRYGFCGCLPGRAVRLSATIAALASGASGASAGIVFLSDATTAESYASATADGAAYGFGDEGRGHTFSDARSNSIAFSAIDGANGGFAVAQGVATGRFAGFAMNVTSAAAAPLAGQEPGRGATVATETETFESVTAFASDFQSLTSQFAGADRATFSFTTEAQAAYEKTVFTRISSTAAAGPGISAPASVATAAGPFPNPGVAVSGEASAEAFSHTAFDYTFEIIGDRPETIAIRYGGKGDAPVGYEIELDDALGSALGADWIDWSGTGEEIWTIGSPGVYSLLIDGYSGVSVTGDPFGDASDYAAGWSLGVFDMSVAAVPELQTWAMMLIGLAALGSAAFRRSAARWLMAPPRFLARLANGRSERASVQGRGRIFACPERPLGPDSKSRDLSGEIAALLHRSW